MKIIKLSSAILALATILLSFSGCFKQIEFQKETPVDQFEWEDRGNYIEITKYKGSAKEVEVPAVIENKAVLSVGEAFNGNIVLETLILPKNCEANLSDCVNLKVLECKGETIPEFLPKGLPDGLEILRLPKVTDVFFNSNYSDHFGSLKKLEIPAAEEVTVYDDSIFKDGIEIILSNELNYFYEVTDFFPRRELTKESSSNNSIVLTEENKSEYYCRVFGCENIVINGKTYTYDD